MTAARRSPACYSGTGEMASDCGKDPQFPCVGARVVDDNGFRATVRYVGPVCTAKDPTSLWIGESFFEDLCQCP